MNPYVPNKDILPFSYLVELALTANQQLDTTLTLQADSWFELSAIMATSSVDAATDFAPNNFSVKIQDQSTGSQLSNARIPQVCLGGIARFYRDQLRPVVWPARAVLQFDFLELSGGVNTATIVLQGYKRFDLMRNPPY